MPRTVLVVHDLHPHMLAFRYHLNNLLGDQLLNFPEGSINSPANVGDLARAVAASPDTRVVCCELV